MGGDARPIRRAPKFANGISGWAVPRRKTNLPANLLAQGAVVALHFQHSHTALSHTHSTNSNNGNAIILQLACGTVGKTYDRR